MLNVFGVVKKFASGLFSGNKTIDTLITKSIDLIDKSNFTEEEKATHLLEIIDKTDDHHSRIFRRQVATLYSSLYAFLIMAKFYFTLKENDLGIQATSESITSMHWIVVAVITFYFGSQAIHKFRKEVKEDVYKKDK